MHLDASGGQALRPSAGAAEKLDVRRFGAEIEAPPGLYIYGRSERTMPGRAANAFLRGAKIIYKAVNAGLLAAGVERASFSLTDQ